MAHLRQRYQVSERRACRAIGQNRSTQRRPRPVLAPEEALRARLRELSALWPRYGYRRAWAQLRLEGWLVNPKRVQRLWQEEGLRVPVQTIKRRRLGQSTVPASRLRAERPNQVWALDFLFDSTADGRPQTRPERQCNRRSWLALGRRPPLSTTICTSQGHYAADLGCLRHRLGTLRPCVFGCGRLQGAVGAGSFSAYQVPKG